MTHETRDHPHVDEVPAMTDAALLRYVKRELAFLSSDEQRRIPRPVHAAIEELLHRHNGKG